MRRRKNDSDDIKAAKISARATIVASVITGIIGGLGGIYLGSILESNKGQYILNQTFYGIIENENSDDITLEEIKQNYTQLQSNYDKKQSENQTLNDEKENKTDELDKANDKIVEMQMQIDQANQDVIDLKTQLNNMPIVDYKNMALCIDVNDIQINSNKSVVTIDGRDYFSKEIVEKLITEDRNLTIKDGTMYIGKVVAEKARLTDQFPMGNIRCTIKDSSIDIHGHTNTDCIVLGNNYYNDAIMKYSVDKKFGSLKGTISVSSASVMGRKGSLTIKADENVMYNKEFNINSPDEPIDIPIDNCAIIDVIYEGDSNFYIIFSEGILYN